MTKLLPPIVVQLRNVVPSLVEFLVTNHLCQPNSMEEARDVRGRLCNQFLSASGPSWDGAGTVHVQLVLLQLGSSS